MAKKGGHRKGNRNADDPDQPQELSGMRLELRSHIRAFALMHCPWPNLRPLDFTYTPDFNPYDPFERYVDAAHNEPRLEAQVVELRKFFPVKFLPFTTTKWMQDQVSFLFYWL